MSTIAARPRGIKCTLKEAVRVKRYRNPADPTEVHPLARIPELTVQIEWDEDTGNWVTDVPRLNGISTFGKTQAEALDNTRELALGYLDSMQNVGLHIPLSAAEIRRVRKALNPPTTRP